jgi:hypothetical protein
VGARRAGVKWGEDMCVLVVNVWVGIYFYIYFIFYFFCFILLYFVLFYFEGECGSVDRNSAEGRDADASV